ncbi:LysR family transcriptional regulator [Comamonas piscis]|uniref:LysR family transcriptional regulator n=1 Tax=Comamonas piscis TaxID=1562974 RepID=A0A7G5EHJ4_9BURK|nr:LysR family transcriptional regulator [Comamonas piscis]QMV73469.1 LysR family transcriptional regulator [Comamonas piscis]WSO31884.1 LysR family transcriptional regulator [Comamonas piscis]
MDSLNAFTVFVQVAEARSFTAAGRLLGISSSAVGKSVARLEEKLGVRLFHRSTRSITPTAEGLLLLERSRRILAEIEAAQTELSQASSAPRGRLRVSLPLVSTLVLPVLADFMRDYPDIQLDLDFSDRLVDVVEEGFDAVVRTGEPADSGLVARKLGHFKMLLVASPEYLAAQGTPHKVQDLLSHRCMHFRWPHSGKLEAWPLPTADDGEPISLPVSMVCNNIETRACFALQGRGIACLPDFAIGDALADGRLVQVMPGLAERKGVFHILWPAGRHAAPKVRALVDYLCARMFAAA